LHNGRRDPVRSCRRRPALDDIDSAINIAARQGGLVALSRRLRAHITNDKREADMLRAIMGAVAIGGVVVAMPVVAQNSGGPRLPLVQDDTSDPDAQALFKELRDRGTRPLNLHRVYSNAPKLARATLALAQALRYDAAVARADKELIILRATQLAQGHYQFGQHRRLAISCGITTEQIDTLPQWRGSKLFSERQRAVLAFADAMASPDGVDDKTFDAMKAFFSSKEIVELTMNAAYYGASSQISRTLRITAEGNPKGGSYGACK
jgi:alkylhydroperoxidase family enzyme